MRKSQRIPSIFNKDENVKERKVKQPSMPPETMIEFNNIIDAVYAKNPIVAQSLHMQSLTALRYSDTSTLIWADFYEGLVLKKSFVVIQQKVYRMVYKRMIDKGKTEQEADTKARSKANVTIYTNEAIKKLLYEIALFNPNKTGQELLFANKHKSSQGTALAVKSVNKILTQVKAELNLPYTLGTHSFRKFMALNLLRAGANVADIRDLLGHNNVSSTDKYLVSCNGELRDLVDKLNY
ncbi:TPA: tyrosine-type recombinase/integrase [Photobacterium damselae]